MGGTGGSGDLCEGVTCADNDCRSDGICDAGDGVCDYTLVADGTECAGGMCQAGVCDLTGTVLPCTEQGIRNAIAAGGGPYTFDCDGPVVTEAEIIIDNDVILDGEGNLTVDGDEDHQVFSVAEGVTAELRGLTVTRGRNSRGSGGIENSGTLTVTNSTVAGNSGVFGGGILNDGTLTLANSTVSGNLDVGIGNSSASTLTLTNSVVDGDCGGDITSNGYNIESPGNSCGFDQGTDQVDVTEGQLNLGPLQDNGGPTETHALLPGSVAIDVIPADMCEVTEDQRGEPRPGGTMCDVGSFEVQP